MAYSLHQKLSNMQTAVQTSKVSLFLAAASGSAPCTSPQRSPESGRTFLWRDHSFAPAPMLNAPSKIALCFMIAIFQQLVWWLPMAMDILSHYCAV
ncbi:Os01g0664432 [Oryza sativa Japonica Group]|uniref:Os01g0664432 protein n=1 Tax=Oryza sativa subsp. japonica TaxID=39947 RepID=A0A0P0V6B6_ORYSJ|nr:Os01g0664432 [Oryza sativa Japonica Group]